MLFYSTLQYSAPSVRHLYESNACVPMPSTVMRTHGEREGKGRAVKGTGHRRRNAIKGGRLCT